jgi:protein required for attachment to host cells
MSESLSKRVIAEYDKDLVNLPIDEIQRHLVSER